MASKEETNQAILAVKNGVANSTQQEIARRAAQQAGSVGNAARAAFQGK